MKIAFIGQIFVMKVCHKLVVNYSSVLMLNTYITYGRSVRLGSMFMHKDWRLSATHLYITFSLQLSHSSEIVA